MNKYKLIYKRKCLKCLYSDGLSHELIWERESMPYDSKFPKDTFGHQFILNLKDELTKKQIKCPKCEAIGLFDVWDIQFNGNITYSRPSVSSPLIEISIDKVKGIATQRINTLGQVSSGSIEQAMKMLFRHLCNYSDNVFISYPEGTFNTIIFFYGDSMFDSKLYFNKCKFIGFSREEILYVLKTVMRDINIKLFGDKYKEFDDDFKFDNDLK